MVFPFRSSSLSAVVAGGNRSLRIHPRRCSCCGVIIRESRHSFGSVVFAVAVAVAYQAATSSASKPYAASRMPRASRRSASQAAKLAGSSSGASRRRA